MKKETTSTVVVENTGKEGSSTPKESKTASKKIYKKLVILLLILLVAGLSLAFYTSHREPKKVTSSDIAEGDKELSMSSEYLEKNDKDQALDHARKALEANPNNENAILAVASLVKDDDPDESKRLYARALDLQKKRENPDVAGKTSIAYWGAAQLAELAGQTDEAKAYYQKAIDAARPSNVDDEYVVAQSQSALKRLK